MGGVGEARRGTPEPQVSLGARSCCRWRVSPPRGDSCLIHRPHQDTQTETVQDGTSNLTPFWLRPPDPPLEFSAPGFPAGGNQAGNPGLQDPGIRTDPGLRVKHPGVPQGQRSDGPPSRSVHVQHKHNLSKRDLEAAGPGRGVSPSEVRGGRSPRLSASASTFSVGGCPGNEAPHQAAVQQDLGGEAVTPAQVLQPLPPLAPLGAHAGATNTGWVSDR